MGSEWRGWVEMSVGSGQRRGGVDCRKIGWVEGRPWGVQRCEGEGMEGEGKGWMKAGRRLRQGRGGREPGEMHGAAQQEV